MLSLSEANLSQQVLVSVVTGAERDKLIFDNQGLAYYHAKKWAGIVHSVPVEDLVQCGFIGLQKAALSYEEGHGTAFSHWATFKIRAEIQAELIRMMTIVHIPKNKLKKVKVHTEEMVEESIPDTKAISAFDAQYDVAIILKDLSDDEKELIRLRITENLSYAKMGEVLNIPSSTASYYIHRLYAKLNTRLNPACESCAYLNFCQINDVRMCFKNGELVSFNNGYAP